MGTPGQHEITFTPLRRNRFRCNHNGEIVGRKGIDACRNRLFGEMHPRKPMSRISRLVRAPAPAPAPVPAPAPAREKVKYEAWVPEWSSLGECPGCGVLSRVEVEDTAFTCSECGARVGVIR